MTKIKLCGLSRSCDIDIANELKPEYIGFVFANKSKRYVTYEKAQELKKILSPKIKAVGVFVDEKPDIIANLLNHGVIDMAQLHGKEDNEYIKKLRTYTEKPVIKAFRIKTEKDLPDVENCIADYIMLDSGAGTGTMFDWEMIQHIKKRYFLAGGLSPENAEKAIKMLHPYAVDVSSGIETDGYKDKAKMASFVAAVRKEEKND